MLPLSMISSTDLPAVLVVLLRRLPAAAAAVLGRVFGDELRDPLAMF